MASVYLTEKQRQDAAMQKLYKKLGSGLAGFQSQEKLTRQQIGAGLGISRNTVSKFISAEDVSMNVSTLLRMIYMSGFEVKRRDP